jgi:uncharacterized membrane protein YqhA
MAKRRGSRPIFTGGRRRPRRWLVAAVAIGIALALALLLYALLVGGAPLNELL